jgi:hypothetical protein
MLEKNKENPAMLVVRLPPSFDLVFRKFCRHAVPSCADALLSSEGVQNNSCQSAMSLHLCCAIDSGSTIHATQRQSSQRRI